MSETESLEEITVPRLSLSTQQVQVTFEAVDKGKEIDLNERLARLLEPEPGLIVAAGGLSPLGWFVAGDGWDFGSEVDWQALSFMNFDDDCFAAVDEMVRRGYRYSLVMVDPPVEGHTHMGVFSKHGIDTTYFDERYVGLATNRREALVRAMIEALEAESGIE